MTALTLNCNRIILIIVKTIFLFIHNTNKISVKIQKQYDFLSWTLQNGLVYLSELNSTDGLNNHTLDGILRSSLTKSLTIQDFRLICLAQLHAKFFSILIFLQHWVPQVGSPLKVSKPGISFWHQNSVWFDLAKSVVQGMIWNSTRPQSRKSVLSIVGCDSVLFDSAR